MQCTMGAPLCPMRNGAGPSVPSSLMQGEYMPRGTRYKAKRTARYEPRIATCLTATQKQQGSRVLQNFKVYIPVYLKMLKIRNYQAFLGILTHTGLQF